MELEAQTSRGVFIVQEINLLKKKVLNPIIEY